MSEFLTKNSVNTIANASTLLNALIVIVITAALLMIPHPYGLTLSMIVFVSALLFRAFIPEGPRQDDLKMLCVLASIAGWLATLVIIVTAIGPSMIADAEVIRQQTG